MVIALSQPKEKLKLLALDATKLFSLLLMFLTNKLERFPLQAFSD